MNKQNLKMSIWGYAGSGIMFYELLETRKVLYSGILMIGFIGYFGYKGYKRAIIE